MTRVAIPAGLEDHLRAKLGNRYWLEPCLEGNANAFPYRPDENGRAQVETAHPIRPKAATLVNPTPQNGGEPLFLVNIPHGVSPSKRHTSTGVDRVMNLLRNESFGTTAEASRSLVGERTATVIGMNQIRSIDSSYNRSFKRFIEALRFPAGLPVRIFGFFWEPQWTRWWGEGPQEGPKPSQKWEKVKWDSLNSKTLYALSKAYRLLKFLSPDSAKKVRKEHEQPKKLHPSILAQIPYQGLRERIKNSKPTRDFLGQMEQGAPQSNIYFTTMDADTQNLRPKRGDPGAFSRMETLIAQHHEPSIVSLGYQLPPTEAPLLRLAVKMDMAVRATMPMPYFPEPCAGFKVRKANEPNFLYELTFKGAGRGLESRRLIESGRNRLRDGAVLGGEGIITTTPNRMKTKTNQAPELTLDRLKQKSSLQALRSNRIQTHAFPKQWADVFYAGLGFSSGRVTNVTTPMMGIFSIFDPISRMLEGKYKKARFTLVLNQYETRTLTQTEQTKLTKHRKALSDLRMPQEKIDLIERTARASGLAIYRTLKQAVADLS